MNRNEFDQLRDFLEGEGYATHGYRGSLEGTIDDGSSNTFEGCKKFSVFTIPENEGSIKLDVYDSKLQALTEDYFAIY